MEGLVARRIARSLLGPSYTRGRFPLVRHLPEIIASHASGLFWDVEPESLDLEMHEDFVLGRVLSLGSFEDLTALREEIGDDRIRQFVERAPHRLDRRSRRFFEVVLGARSEEACTTKPFRRTSESLFRP